jgi:flagellar protein FliS
MTRLDPWSSYRQVATQTASPGQLVLMLYDGAIRFLERALSGFDLDDPAESNQTINNNILRTQQILDELSASLNLPEGGELAATLRSLYEYLHRRLQDANVRKQSEGIREAITRLSELRDAWAAMLNGQPLPARDPALEAYTEAAVA